MTALLLAGLFATLLLGVPAGADIRFISVGLSGSLGNSGSLGESGNTGLDVLDADDFSMVFLSADTAVVYDLTGLSQALTDATTTTIHFGSDITTTGGITINKNKPFLVIDGTNPLEDSKKRHTLWERVSTDIAHTISLYENGSLNKITTQNLIVQGGNYYGFINVREAAKNIHLIYDNVDYYGPQPTWNLYGTAHYKDCYVELGQHNRANSHGELAEARAVSFEGVVTVTQVQENGHNILNFTGGGEHSVEILPYADVTVTIFNKAGITNGFVTSPTAFPMTVGEGAKFTYYAPSKLWVSNPFSAFTVEDNASVHLEATIAIQGSNFLRVDGPLTVGKDAEFHLINRGNTTYQLLIMNGGDATFNDPKSVLFYSPERRPFYFNTTARSYITDAQQHNYWTTGGPGGWNDLPRYGWRKNDGSNIAITGKVTTIGPDTTFSSIESNYNPDDSQPDVAPSVATYDLRTARVIAFGRLDVEAGYEYYEGSQLFVYGETTPGADILVQYVDAQGILVTLEGTAGEDGGFRIPVETPIPNGGTVTVRAHYNYLYAEDAFSVGPPTLSYVMSPKDIEFQTTTLTADPVVVPRVEGDYTIAIHDNRGIGSNWRLTAKVATPLTPGKDQLPVLDNALVFQDGDGDENTHILDTTVETPIHRHTTTTANETTTLEWGPEHGILAYVHPALVSVETSYTGSILWTLEDAP